MLQSKKKRRSIKLSNGFRNFKNSFFCFVSIYQMGNKSLFFKYQTGQLLSFSSNSCFVSCVINKIKLLNESVQVEL